MKKRLLSVIFSLVLFCGAGIMPKGEISKNIPEISVTASAESAKLATPKVTVSNAATGVKVTWNKVTGAGGYIVYRKTGSADWSRIKEISSGSTVSYTDTAAKSGTSYYYTVRAKAGSTKSDFKSSSAIKFLSTPTVKAANVNSGVKVTWNKVTGAGGYIVYRKTGSGSWSRIKEISSGSTVSYTDTTAKSGTSYYYTVRAKSGSTMGSFKSSSVAKFLSTPTVKAANIDSGVKVTWNKVAGAGGYIVYRKTGSGSWSRIKEISSGSTVSYTDTTAKSGTSYYYTVRAKSGNTTSDFKSSASVNIPNPQNNQIVYRTDSGHRYHHENPCGSGTYYECTLEDAIKSGLTPCEKCVLH